MSKITIKLSPTAPRAISRAPGEQMPQAEGGEPVIHRKRRVIVVPSPAAAAPAAPGKPTPAAKPPLKAKTAPQKPAAKPAQPAPKPVTAKPVPVPQQQPLSDAEKRQRKAAKVAAAQEVLRQHFPEAFSTVRPLAIGISDALNAERKLGRLPLGGARIAMAMYAWVNSEEYRLALVAGGPRFNLAGEPQGEVSPEHVADAAQKLERRRAKARAKREAQTADTVPNVHGGRDH